MRLSKFFVKKVVRMMVVLIIVILIGTFLPSNINETVVSTVYNVTGIVFSIGMGVIVSFSLDGVRDAEFIKKIRERIDATRTSFIIEYVISTITYIIYSQSPSNAWNLYSTKSNLCVLFNMSYFAVGTFFVSVVYFILNFIQIQKLKRKIFDTNLENS